MGQEPSNLILTPAMIAAGVEALAFARDTRAEKIVEAVYRAMMQALPIITWHKPGLPH
jgi:hypothetical protein